MVSKEGKSFAMTISIHLAMFYERTCKFKIQFNLKQQALHFNKQVFDRSKIVFPKHAFLRYPNANGSKHAKTQERKNERP